MKLDDLRKGFQGKPKKLIVCPVCLAKKSVDLEHAEEAAKHCAECEARMNIAPGDYEPDIVYDFLYYETAPCDFMETRPEDLFRRGGTDHQCSVKGVVYDVSNGREVAERIALCGPHWYQKPPGVVLTPRKKCRRCGGKGYVDSKIGRATCPQCPDLEAANYLRRNGWKPSIGKSDCAICGEAGFWTKGVDIACRDHAVRLQKRWDASRNDLLSLEPFK